MTVGDRNSCSNLVRGSCWATSDDVALIDLPVFIVQTMAMLIHPQPLQIKFNRGISAEIDRW